MLREIPYMPLTPLKNLRVLDLSYNSIQSILPESSLFYEPNSMPKLTLDTIHLDFNRIEHIPTASFAQFDVVNVTYLDGNPIRLLGDEAFRGAHIRELYIRRCGLSFISPTSFEGIGNTLQILDLSGNNITDIPENSLKGFADFK